MPNHPRETPAPTPTLEAFEKALDDLMNACLLGNHLDQTPARDNVIALFSAPVDVASVVAMDDAFMRGYESGLKQRAEELAANQRLLDRYRSAPTPTRAAVAWRVEHKMPDGSLRLICITDDLDKADAARKRREVVSPLYADTPPRGEAVARPVNFCSTCGKDVRGLRDVDGIHTCHNPRDAR